MVSEIHLLPNKKVTLVLGHARWSVTSKAAPFKLLSSGIFSPVDFDNCSGEARDLKEKKKADCFNISYLYQICPKVD